MEKREKILFLHKDEWGRMKKVGSPNQETHRTNEYVQSLIEKSQQWVNSWPDSIQGHILKSEKEREQRERRINDRAIIRLFKKEQKEIAKNNKCIEKAKQIIFDDSCYGRQLISALLESKTFEERDAQIEFKKKIKENSPDEVQYHNVFGNSLDNVINTKHEEKAACRREEEKEVARMNQSIYLTHRENMKKEKEREKKMEIEDLRLLAELNEKEALNEAHEKSLFKKDLEEFKAEQKQIQDRKAFREKQEEQLIEIWRKYEDRKNTMMKKIHEDRFKKSQPTEIYELVKKLYEDENNRYEEFVNKGVVTLARRLQINEQKDNQKKEDERKKQYLLLESNKRLEDAKRIDNINKNVCDRQCIVGERKNISKIKNSSINKPREQETATFVPSNHSLVQKLRMREKQHSPWSGADAAHAQFARAAGHTLRACRYKHAARAVVQEYLKLNGLNPQELPIDV